MDHVTKALLDRSVELLKVARTIQDGANEAGINLFQVNDLAARSANLIHSALGPKSVYAENLRTAQKEKKTNSKFHSVAGVLQAFHLDLAKGHLLNIRHEVEAVVVSELVNQSRKLLATKGVHPAASVIVACAGVEEFLRNWCMEKGLPVPDKQRSISRYALELRKAGHIPLPQERRIQSWADYRNDAAHGDKWSKLSREIADRIISEIEGFLIEYQRVLG
jgi:hypothetical protein